MQFSQRIIDLSPTIVYKIQVNGTGISVDVLRQDKEFTKWLGEKPNGFVHIIKGKEFCIRSTHAPSINSKKRIFVCESMLWSINDITRIEMKEEKIDEFLLQLQISFKACVDAFRIHSSPPAPPTSSTPDTLIICGEIITSKDMTEGLAHIGLCIGDTFSIDIIDLMGRHKITVGCAVAFNVSIDTLYSIVDEHLLIQVLGPVDYTITRI